MIARIACTAGALLFAAGNFFSGVLMPPGPLNPFGIAFLALSGVLWFGWEMIGDAYAYREEIGGLDASNFTYVRLGPFAIRILNRK